MTRPRRKRGYRRIVVDGLAFQWSHELWLKPYCLDVVLDEESSSRACRLTMQKAWPDREWVPRHALPAYVQDAIEKVLARSNPGHDIRRHFYEAALSTGTISDEDDVVFFGKDRIREEVHPVFVASIIRLALENGWDPTERGSMCTIRYSREHRTWEWWNTDRNDVG